MTFQPRDVEKFLNIFNQYKTRIKSAEGCTSLELIQNTEFPDQISTLSQWDSQFYLDNYRGSDVFKEVWPMTKELFSAKPRATSFEILVKV
jgi:heme-degrading monooxygenase HmoA